MNIKFSIAAIAGLLISAITFTSAQKMNIKVTESNEHIGNGKNNALVVTVYETTPEEAAGKWKSLMKEYKAKVSMGDEVFADNAVIKTINDNNTIDVFAKTEKIKEGETKLIVAFDLGGAFLNSSDHKEKFIEAKKLVYDFAVKTTKEAIAGQLKSAGKVFSKLEDDQHDLEKQQKRLNSNVEEYKAKIEDYNKRIKEAQDNLAKNKTDQEKKKGELDAQKKVVDAITAKGNSVE